MATPSLIDARAHERLLEFLNQYELNDRFATSLAAINMGTPTAFDAMLWQRLAADVNTFRAFHEKYPFVVAKNLGDRVVGTPLRQVADNQRITLQHSELAEHVGIFGRSGGGKTTLAQQFAHEAYRQGLSVITIDGKDDARYLPVQYPSTIIIDKTTPLPLLEPPSWLTLSEARSLLIAPLKHTMWGGEGLQQVATESHQHTLTEVSNPSVADWRDEIRKLPKKGDTYTRRDRCDGLAQRLDRLIDQYPGLGTTRAGTGMPLDILCTRPVYFGFGQHTEIEDFLTAWLLELRFSYNRSKSNRALNSFVLLDESNLLVHDRTINEEAPLASTFPLLREFGISVCLTANNYRSVPPPIRSSLYLQVAMNLTDAPEANDISKTFGLTNEQREYLDKRLTRGTCIVRLADRWKHPLLATFDPLTIDKNVTTSDWQAAIARTNALARPTAAAREGVTGQQPALPAPPRLIPAAGIPHNTIALNTNEEKLLRFIGEHRVALTTECEMHPQLLTRAKRKLLTLGLITEERITARAGRGGQANALALTSTGCAWLRLTPGGAGGGGLQHQYLVRRLLHVLPGAQRELSLNGKRVDLLFTYTDEHAWISAITGIALNSGDHVAIEVEISQPEKTAPSNIEKNAAAGVRLTLIAVLPGARERTSDALAHLAHHAIVINVFDLLRRES